MPWVTMHSTRQPVATCFLPPSPKGKPEDGGTTLSVQGGQWALISAPGLERDLGLWPWNNMEGPRGRYAKWGKQTHEDKHCVISVNVESKTANVWQNPLKCCEVISLQLIKINEKNKNKKLNSQAQRSRAPTRDLEVGKREDTGLRVL